MCNLKIRNIQSRDESVKFKARNFRQETVQRNPFRYPQLQRGRRGPRNNQSYCYLTGVERASVRRLAFLLSSACFLPSRYAEYFTASETERDAARYARGCLVVRGAVNSDILSRSAGSIRATFSPLLPKNVRRRFFKGSRRENHSSKFVEHSLPHKVLFSVPCKALGGRAFPPIRQGARLPLGDKQCTLQ